MLAISPCAICGVSSLTSKLHADAWALPVSQALWALAGPSFAAVYLCESAAHPNVFLDFGACIYVDGRRGLVAVASLLSVYAWGLIPICTHI